MSNDVFQVPKGVIVVTTYGDVCVETTQSLAMMSRYLEQRGLKNVEIAFTVGTLVDKARNEAVRTMLEDKDNEWIWFLDADMEWHPTIVDHMFMAAFKECQWADIIGGYAQLRGPPYLPTIDTGTGMWESHLPNQGPMEVIRTGSACVLIRRKVFETMEYPWYGIRPAPRAIDVITELDNYARIKFDGNNPFTKCKEWDLLAKCAMEDAANRPRDNVSEYHTVGEDSNLCDKARALGFRIIVQTNAVCCHIDRKKITPEDHVKAQKEVREAGLAASGILS